MGMTSKILIPFEAPQIIEHCPANFPVIPGECFTSIGFFRGWVTVDDLGIVHLI